MENLIAFYIHIYPKSVKKSNLFQCEGRSDRGYHLPCIFHIYDTRKNQSEWAILEYGIESHWGAHLCWQIDTQRIPNPSDSASRREFRFHLTRSPKTESIAKK